MDSSTLMWTFFWLYASDADTVTERPSMPAPSASSAPFRFGTRAHRRTPPDASARTAASTSAAPAMAGTALGDTKDTASISVTPAWMSAPISRTRSPTSTGASDCSPSRGPTSRSTTRSAAKRPSVTVVELMATVSPTAPSFADVDGFLWKLAGEHRREMQPDLRGDRADVARQELL